MTISKTDFAAWLFLALTAGWFAGRVCEAIAVGNL
jgi:hypothetical protein